MNVFISSRKPYVSQNRPMTSVPNGSQIKSIDIENDADAVSTSVNEDIHNHKGDLIQAPSSPIISAPPPPPPPPREHAAPSPSTLDTLSRQLRSSKSRTSAFRLRLLDRFDRVGVLATVPEGQKESVSCEKSYE